MIRRGIVLVFATTTFAVENGALVLIFLRDRVRFIWGDNGDRNWVYGSFSSIEKPLFWIRRYLDGVAVIVQYRAYYRDVTAPMKNCYRQLKKKL